MATRQEDYDSVFEAFRARVRARLQELGWSQNQFAAKVGASKQYVSNMLNGRREPGIRTILRWSEALMVEPGYLLIMDKEKKT